MTIVRVPSSLVEDDPVVLAPLAGLVPSSDEDPGVERRRCGRGFRYLDLDGTTLQPPRRDHYLSLAIPPAWAEVWLCPVPIGHLQATGRDAAGRKQYRYHDAYRELRDRQKFDRMSHFLRALKRLRDATGVGLGEPLGTRSHAVAAALRLVDCGLLRVGNERSASEGRFGATTLTLDHLEADGRRATIAFVGKGNVEREVEVDDDELVAAPLDLSAARQGGGAGTESEALFWYERDDGEPARVTSSDLNAEMASVVGPCFTVKDFRTWGGSREALVARAQGASPLEAVDAAADVLGNTRAVARASYVHPAVLDADDETVRRLWRSCRSSAAVSRGDRALDRLLADAPTLFS